MRVYGVQIDDRDAKYNFNESKVYYTLYQKSLLKAHSEPLISLGFEGVKEEIIINHFVYIISASVAKGRIEFSCPFRSGKRQHN